MTQTTTAASKNPAQTTPAGSFNSITPTMVLFSANLTAKPYFDLKEKLGLAEQVITAEQSDAKRAQIAKDAAEQRQNPHMFRNNRPDSGAAQIKFHDCAVHSAWQDMLKLGFQLTEVKLERDAGKGTLKLLAVFVTDKTAAIVGLDEQQLLHVENIFSACWGTVNVWWNPHKSSSTVNCSTPKLSANPVRLLRFGGSLAGISVYGERSRIGR